LKKVISESKKMDNNIKLSDHKIVGRVNELYHDLQASEFNEVHARRHHVERAFWECQVCPAIIRSKDSRIVDLCSGTGFVPSVLLPRLPARFSLECLDVSSKALENTRERMGAFGARISLHVGSAEDLPFEDESISCITINAGLHHVPNWRLCLQEIGRVLKPEGLFCLGHEPNKLFFNSQFLLKMERLIWHLFWYSSPKQNVRRFCKLIGRSECTAYEIKEHLTEINEALIAEGIVNRSMTNQELRKLVDPHTHNKGDKDSKSGFNSAQILTEYFPNYTLEALCFSDYGGDMLRKFPFFRDGFDMLMGRLFRGKGRLFSWIIRKSVS